jgi:hypothetical protein
LPRQAHHALHTNPGAVGAAPLSFCKEPHSAASQRLSATGICRKRRGNGGRPRADFGCRVDPYGGATVSGQGCIAARERWTRRRVADRRQTPLATCRIRDNPGKPTRGNGVCASFRGYLGDFQRFRAGELFELVPKQLPGFIPEAFRICGQWVLDCLHQPKSFGKIATARCRRSADTAKARCGGDCQGIEAGARHKSREREARSS